MEPEKKKCTVYDCIHGQSAPCLTACPLDLDVRELMKKLKKGSFIAAYNQYRESVIFPGLVHRLCPGPCIASCEKEIEENHLNLLKLEEGLYEAHKTKDPANFNAPKVGKAVAVVGATLRGITAILKLGQIGYDMTLFESSDRILSDVEKFVDRETIDKVTALQMKFVKYEANFNVDYSALDLSSFDIVIYAVNEDLGIKDSDTVFVLPENAYLINDIQAGKKVFKQVDWYVKTNNKKSFDDEIVIRDLTGSEKTGEKFLEGDILQKPQLRIESDKCTLCDCSECLEKCVLLRDYGFDVKDLTRAVGLSLNVFEHAEVREGTRQISGCNDCGLCEAICPNKINVGEFLLQSRTTLYNQGHIPKAYHEFWMRDLAFADSDEASLFYMPKETSTYMFFPGCQTGGSDPRYVTMTYDKLLEKNPDTSLFIYCCGAPLLWEGDRKAMKLEHEKIKSYWEKAGKPTIVTGCPSCHRMFREYIPELPVKMVYEIMDIEVNSKLPFEKANVFDPCSSKKYPEVQDLVRDIAAKTGVELEELKYNHDKSQCCSWGGHAYNINRKVVNLQVKEQIGLSDLPYITYCTNCNDIFNAKGKDTRHILDIIHGINLEGRKAPTLKDRRVNRRRLKRELVEKFKFDTFVPEEPKLVDIRCTDEVERKFNEDLILDEDISAVISSAESTGYYIIMENNNHRVSHLKRGEITYWVEYAPNEDGSYTVFNNYCHRMYIKVDVVQPEKVKKYGEE